MSNTTSHNPNRNGFAERLWSTTAMARQFGVPERDTRHRVNLGQLVPTARTASGMARWRRDDFAAQIAPHTPRPLPRAVEYPSGVTVWAGLTQVAAQPGRAIEVTARSRTLSLLPEEARQLAAVLPAAVDVAAAQDPDCTCRELTSPAGTTIVPVPSCPVHEGATP